jgi:hypothetical protein
MEKKTQILSYLPLVGRSKNASAAQRFSGGGPLLVAGTAPHPDRFALRPHHKGEVNKITDIITGGMTQ